MKKIALMIGSQASGKTFFAENYLVKNGYEFINGDVFFFKNEKNIPFEKIENIIKDALKSDYQGIAFEFSFSNKKNREKFLNIAQKYNFETEYFLIQTSLEDSLFQNSQRTEYKITEEIIRQRNVNLLSDPPLYSEGVNHIYNVFINNGEFEIVSQTSLKELT